MFFPLSSEMTFKENNYVPPRPSFYVYTVIFQIITGSKQKVLRLGHLLNFEGL